MKNPLVYIVLLLSISYSTIVFAQVADAGPDQTLNCNFPTVTLGGDSTSMGPEFTYEWTIFGDSISNQPFVEVSNSGTYVLEVTNTTTNAIAMDTVSIAVQFEFIGLSIFNSGTLTCEDNIATLEVFSEIFYFEDTETLWQTVNGNIISDPNQNTIEVDQPGEYTVVVTNLSSGCTGTAIVIVNQDTNVPIASIASSDILDCNNQEVLLDGSSSSAGPDIAYTWVDAAGVTISNSLTVWITDCGLYTLQVENVSSGCFSTSSVAVLCDFEEPVSFIANPGLLSQGTTLVLDGSASSQGNNFLYNWTAPGGGIISNPNESSITIDQPGEYCLTVSNLDNGCTSTSCVFVEQNTEVTVIADAGPDIIIDCTDFQVDLCLGGENTSIGSEFIYEWFSASGALVSNERMFKPTDPFVINDFPFTLVVTNTVTGEQASDTIQFSDNRDIPTISVESSSVLNCIDTTVTINLTIDSPSTSEVSIMWDGPGIINDLTDEDIAVDQPGTYTVIVTNIENGCLVTATVFIDQDIESFEVNVPPSILLTCDTFSVLDPTPIFEQLNFDTCIGFWQAQEGLTVDTFPLAIATQSGTYIFNKVDPVNGCLGKIIFNVDIPDKVIADAGADTIIDCNSIIIGGGNTSVGGNFAYTWNTSNGCIVELLGTQAAVECAGTYELIVTDLETGCVASDEVIVTATNLLEVVVDITDISCNGGADGMFVIFVSGGTPPYTFENPIQMGLPAGNYSTTITDADGCTIIETFTITEPPALALEFTINADNQIEAIVTGGVGGYTYDWNVQADSSIIDNPINGTEYELTVTDANGCTLTDTYIFVIDGVFSTSAKQLSVFPNPTDGLLHLQLDAQRNQAISEIKIFDIQGIPMNFEKALISNSKITLDLSHLHVGAYILQVVIDGNLYYQKVIVF